MYNELDTSSWEYPRVYDYGDHFSKEVASRDIDFGTCLYCKKRTLLVKDAHLVESCLECLNLDHYLLYNKGETNV